MLELRVEYLDGTTEIIAIGKDKKKLFQYVENVDKGYVLVNDTHMVHNTYNELIEKYARLGAVGLTEEEILSLVTYTVSETGIKII